MRWQGRGSCSAIAGEGRCVTIFFFLNFSDFLNNRKILKNLLQNFSEKKIRNFKLSEIVYVSTF